MLISFEGFSLLEVWGSFNPSSNLLGKEDSFTFSSAVTLAEIAMGVEELVCGAEVVAVDNSCTGDVVVIWVEVVFSSVVRLQCFPKNPEHSHVYPPDNPLRRQSPLFWHGLFLQGSAVLHLFVGSSQPEFPRFDKFV